MLSIAATARQADLVCGTERHGWQEALALHRRQAAKGLTRRAALPIGRDSGNIAILYTSGGVLAPRNLFNLQAKGITFKTSGTGYSFVTADAVYDQDPARDGVVVAGLGDDDTRRIALPFPFPFFGKTHREAWINSDGNISFEEGDPASTARTIGRLTGGPPRIAPLLLDLDPSVSQQGVYVFAQRERLTVTWVSVPVFTTAGTGPLQTFQVRLFPDGSIEFAYPAVTSQEAVVGIAPGRSAGTPRVVSFREGSSEEFASAIVERFLTAESLDPVLLAQRFYENHDDSYDYLVVYNNISLPARTGAVATEQTVRSRFRTGFGDTEVDNGAYYGSADRLQAFLNMGHLTQYPADPHAPVPARGLAGDTPLSVLAHETGHLFLALASIRDETNPASRPMLGGGMAHWAFPFNSEASFLEGNRIEDLGENALPRFRTVATAEQFSPLDQYLMGFRGPEEVPPTFLVRNSGRSNTDLPSKGATFNGLRQNITVDEVIAAEGRRSPDHTLAQREFRMAFILLTREGAEPSQDELNKVDRLRREFEGYFANSTGGRATVSTTLIRNVRISFAPAAGVVQGADVEGFVQLDRPAEAPVTVLLKPRNGIVSLPESVTVPAGERKVPLIVRGLSAGVDEVAMTPSDSQYAVGVARIQVMASPSGLTLTVTGGDGQTAEPGVPLPQLIEMRVSDINLIPYAGIAVRAEAPAAGTVEPAMAVTGADGIARFRWTPAAGPLIQLIATIEGTETTATATAAGSQ